MINQNNVQRLTTAARNLSVSSCLTAFHLVKAIDIPSDDDVCHALWIMTQEQRPLTTQALAFFLLLRADLNYRPQGAAKSIREAILAVPNCQKLQQVIALLQ